MGGIFQFLYLLAVSLAILAVLLLVAFLVGRFFRNRKTRRQIMIGAIAIYFLVFVCFWGYIAFILSGDLN